MVPALLLKMSRRLCPLCSSRRHGRPRQVDDAGPPGCLADLGPASLFPPPLASTSATWSLSWSHTRPTAKPNLTVDDSGTGSGWHSLGGGPTAARHTHHQTSQGVQRPQPVTHSLPALPPDQFLPDISRDTRSQATPGAPPPAQDGRDRSSSRTPLTEKQKAREATRGQ